MFRLPKCSSAFLAFLWEHMTKNPQERIFFSEKVSLETRQSVQIKKKINIFPAYTEKFISSEIFRLHLTLGIVDIVIHVSDIIEYFLEEKKQQPAAKEAGRGLASAATAPEFFFVVLPESVLLQCDAIRWEQFLWRCLLVQL